MGCLTSDTVSPCSLYVSWVERHHVAWRIGFRLRVSDIQFFSMWISNFNLSFRVHTIYYSTHESNKLLYAKLHYPNVTYPKCIYAPLKRWSPWSWVYVQERISDSRGLWFLPSLPPSLTLDFVTHCINSTLQGGLGGLRLGVRLT